MRRVCYVVAVITVLALLAFGATLTSCSCSTTHSHFAVRDFAISPSTASIGDYILIEFWIDNTANIGVITEVILYVDDEKIQTKEIVAEKYSTTRVYFRVAAETIGTHVVTIRNTAFENLSGTFEVKAP